MMDLEQEEMMNAVKATMDDFINKLKQMPFYDVYEHMVKKKEDDTTHKFLQMLTMLHSMGDNKFLTMMTSVAQDLLFKTIDQKLRNEILEMEDEE